jgi:hypothetical protein
LEGRLQLMKVRMLGKAMGEALSRSSSRDRRSEAWGTPSSSFWPFFFSRPAAGVPASSSVFSQDDSYVAGRFVSGHGSSRAIISHQEI